MIILYILLLPCVRACTDEVKILYPAKGMGACEGKCGNITCTGIKIADEPPCYQWNCFNKPAGSIDIPPPYDTVHVTEDSFFDIVIMLVACCIICSVSPAFAAGYIVGSDKEGFTA